MIIKAYILSLIQIFDTRIFKIIFLSIFLSIFCCSLISFLIFFLIESILNNINFPLSIFFSSISGFIFLIICLWVIFPPLLIFINSLFSGKIIKIIESNNYKNINYNYSNTFVKELKFQLSFIIIFVLINLALIPFLIFPPIYFIFYWIINGYLIGKEFSGSVLIKYINYNDIKKFNNKNRLNVYLFGIILAIIFSIPILNLFGPIIGTASMVHMYMLVNNKKRNHI